MLKKKFRKNKKRNTVITPIDESSTEHQIEKNKRKATVIVKKTVDNQTSDNKKFENGNEFRKPLEEMITKVKSDEKKNKATKMDKNSMIKKKVKT